MMLKSEWQIHGVSGLALFWRVFLNKNYAVTILCPCVATSDVFFKNISLVGIHFYHVALQFFRMLAKYLLWT